MLIRTEYGDFANFRSLMLYMSEENKTSVNINIGDISLSKVYFGDKKIVGIYLGNKKIF